MCACVCARESEFLFVHYGIEFVPGGCVVRINNTMAGRERWLKAEVATCGRNQQTKTHEQSASGAVLEDHPHC